MGPLPNAETAATARHDGDGQPGGGPPDDGGGIAGPIAAIVVNGLLLYVVANLLEWDVLPFLTSDFDRVVPAVTLALAVTIAVNACRLAYRPRWFVIVTDGIAALFSLYASIRVLQVFPFDFDPDGFRWDLVFRAALVIAIAGSVIAVLVAPLKLLSDADDGA